MSQLFMDASYVQDMPVYGELIDFHRGVRITRHMLKGSPKDDMIMSAISYHVLLLWREAGSPLPAVFHLGAFYKVEAIR